MLPGRKSLEYKYALASYLYSPCVGEDYGMIHNKMWLCDIADKLKSEIEEFRFPYQKKYGNNKHKTVSNGIQECSFK